MAKVSDRTAAASIAETSLFYVITSDGTSDWKASLSLVRSEVLTGVNVDIVPDADGTRSLGATATRWGTVYTDALDVTNNITVGGTVDGRDLATDGSKLDLIEAGATADQTPAEILTATLTVDGAGSLLDADLLDGLEATAFATAAQGATADAALPRAGGNLTGNVTADALVTVDGRDLSVDGAKLDLIEAAADVTDTANVTAAGALMDSEVTNLAQVKAFSSADYATAAQGTTADSALQDVVDDTTPTLGGDLAAGGNNITDLGDVTFKTGAAGGTLRTGTSAADKFQLQAYDVDGAAYVTLIEADAGNDVRLQIPVDNLDLEDGTDTTKIAKLDCSGITTGTTRTITVPDEDVTLGKPKETLIVAVSDETTALTTGAAKVTFRMPYAFTISAVRASVTTAPVGSTIVVDINDGGTTIMTTNKLSIDASEKTSTTAATAAGLTDTALADDAEITIDIDQVGSSTAGAGLKVYLIGTRT